MDGVAKAPRDIQATTSDLKILQSILSSIAHDAQHTEPDDILTNALQSCNTEVATLVSILDIIQPGFASTRLRTQKWTAIKAVLIGAKLKKFQDIVGRLKTSLLLVQQTHYGRLNRIQHVANQHALANIKDCISYLSIQPSATVKTVSSTPKDIEFHTEALRAEASRVDSTIKSPVHQYAFGKGPEEATGEITDGLSMKTLSRAEHIPNSRSRRKRTLARHDAVVEYDFGFGTVYIRSKTSCSQLKETYVETRSYLDHEHEHESFFNVCPAAWLVRLGFRYGLHLSLIKSSIRGWKQTLSTSCHVPDDALVFEFCKQGNVSGVRSLLLRGDASVRDVDSQGQTPLFYAARRHSAQLCQLLLDAGAEANIRDYSNRSPLGAARGILGMTMADVGPVMDTLRIFLDCMDFSETASEGWETLIELGEQTVDIGGETVAKRTLFSWILRVTGRDVEENFLEAEYSVVLCWVLRLEKDDMTRSLLQLGGKDAINSRIGVGGYSVLHWQTAYAEDELKFILMQGPDLHLIGYDAYYSPILETPTSLALYSHLGFAKWRYSLCVAGIDLYEFVCAEMQQTPLVDAGWTVETLWALFHYTYEIDWHLLNHELCENCGVELDAVKVQPYWMHILTGIQSGLYHNDSSVWQLATSWEEYYEAEGVRAEGGEGYRDVTTNLDGQPQVLRSLGGDGDENSLQNVTKHHVSSNFWKLAEQDVLNCAYGREEVVCMSCWNWYKEKGKRFTLSDSEDELESDNTDESSDDGFSPFMIHT
ncbi:hypothetical protein JMJ35_001597 [Cladonia borealis]|uniref:Ankyrin n=1 Tax=Cladonia borealis TaxID=184061 RepID=A0AA39V4A0_9LECA|nr:hypothetical protein JMJ35_001597 [Cladonia borealis]